MDPTNLVDPPPSTTTTQEDLTSLKKAQLSLQSLSLILPATSLPLSSPNPAFSLLHSPSISSQISSLLHHPSSGSPDNPLCRWLYDTFNSSDPTLQLLVLRFIPTLSALYLSRSVLNNNNNNNNNRPPPHKPPLAGFEAVLLALYAHETANRNGQSLTVCIPDLSHSSIYHETTAATSTTSAKKEAGGGGASSSSTELNLTVVSGSLEPHGTVRSTRRGRIVGVALELYFSKISQMPVDSKIEFCKFCRVWAGQDGDMYYCKEYGEESADQQGDEGIKEEKNGGKEEEEGRIPLPWELLQPVLRILGHCLMGPYTNKEEDKALHEAAFGACRSLYARSMHDVNPKAILATGSLLRLGQMAMDSNDNDAFDPTELPKERVLSL